MPIDYKNYPDNWMQLRQEILKRSDNRCEFCGVSNYEIGYRNANGDFIAKRKGNGPNGEKKIAIVLTVAHLDHDTTNSDPENLRALCQRCHLNHDRKTNGEKAKRTRAAKRESGKADKAK